MQVVNRKEPIGYTPTVRGINSDQVRMNLLSDENGIAVYEISVAATCEGPVLIKWKIEAIEVAGSWSTNAILDKRFRTDWEPAQIESSIAIDAPLISLYKYDDNNLITFACADAISHLKFEASLREEDNHFYCSIEFFSVEKNNKEYKTKICINTQSKQFSNIIQQVSDWIIENGKIDTHVVPALSKVPLYSTWYSFHQNLEESALIQECELASKMGYQLVIIDDGWQTLDDNRGYDFTGDWKPERIKDPKSFAAKIHDLGMAIMFWYSVPFCGKKSEAYQKFKGKFLTENHHWAPVFDPRFPEVRSYLVNTYTHALTEWKLDGFKLDFIDDFKVYPETELECIDGRDTHSVSDGVDKLITEIIESLRAVKPDVLIEFRQQYISPALRKLGNMFRAFDCPNDGLMNRVRTTDVKLICGDAAVHSDMITWSKNEKVEVAALQFTNLLFSVPQLSVRIAERSKEEMDMISFFTKYWLHNKEILLEGKFNAHKPLANYPILSATKNGKIIYGIYEDVVLMPTLDHPEIDIINGKLTEDIYLNIGQEVFDYEIEVFDCLGNIQPAAKPTNNNGMVKLSCPPNGIVSLKR